MASYKIQIFKGNGCEIGLKIGQTLKGRFDDLIDHFIAIVDKVYHLDFKRLERECFIWLDKLPEEYLIELESMAYGSEVPLNKIAKWIYCDRFIAGGCSSFITMHEGNAWVGRNNDYVGPNLWRNINVIAKDGCIPVVLFGLEGEVFSGTGYNMEKLWLHYNYLPVSDIPDLSEKTIAPFVFIRMALQKCKSLYDVENLLNYTVRDGGMNLFAVDGKNNTFAVYECSCQDYKKRSTAHNFLAGTNHYIELKSPSFSHNSSSSVDRLARMEYLFNSMEIKEPIEDFTQILADPGVEQNHGLTGTVYANIACPALNLYYYASNGFPAASKACFEEVVFP